MIISGSVVSIKVDSATKAIDTLRRVQEVLDGMRDSDDGFPAVRSVQVQVLLVIKGELYKDFRSLCEFCMGDTVVSLIPFNCTN